MVIIMYERDMSKIPGVLWKMDLISQDPRLFLNMLNVEFSNHGKLVL